MKMTKYSLLLFTFFVTLSGCSKDTYNKGDFGNLSTSPSYYCAGNLNNSFDTIGIQLVYSMFNACNFQYSSNDVQAFKNNMIDGFPTSLGNLEIDTTDFGGLSEQEYYLKIAQIFETNSEEYKPTDFVDDFISLENSINDDSMLTDFAKDRLLILAAMCKHSTHFYIDGGFIRLDTVYSSDTVFCVTPDWEARLVNCLREQTNAIFGDNNPVDDIAFVAGLPETWLGLLAYCGWEATWGSYFWSDYVSITSAVSELDFENCDQ